jgi:CRP/FNR family transcriptional regulator, cyclic AMP receptor protein
MPLIPDKAAFQNSLATLPIVTYQPGETVIVDGSKTDRLLVLKKGNVAIVKDDTEIAKVTEPGAVFGELSVLLNQPHTADVRLPASAPMSASGGKADIAISGRHVRF